MRPEQERLNKTRRGLEIWQWLLWALLFVGVAGSVMTTLIKYTYLDPSVPAGTLVSARGTYHFAFTLSLLLLFVVPFSSSFMIGAAHRPWRFVMHLIIVGVLLVYLMAMAITWSRDLARANENALDNRDNPANDYRYCCVYTGTCYLTGVTCNPGVSSSMLHINENFLFKYIFVWLFMAILVMDIVLTTCVYRPRVREYLEAVTPPTTNDEETPPPQPSAPPATEPEPAAITVSPTGRPLMLVASVPLKKYVHKYNSRRK